VFGVARHTQWDYRVRKIAEYWGSDLNRFGREGWELCAIHDDHFILKRPIPGPAVRAILKVHPSTKEKQEMAPGAITVDTTNETATLEFVDDHGDATTAPDGAVVTFTSSDEAVATVAAEATSPLVAAVTPVAVGTSTIGVTIADATGNPIDGPDGAAITVTSVQVTVSAGEAAGAELVLSV
jgi:hypothetical protein